MSLLSPKVRIALTPGMVAVASGKNYRDAAVAAPSWSGALEALADLLASSGLRGRASVTLSHHFAPVHLLSAPPVVLKPAEMQGWISDHLVRQFGETGRNLRVAWQAEPPGNSFLASTIEPNALAELEAVIRSASLEPVQIQPWLVTAWNRRGGKFGRGRAWFALAEPDRLTLAGLEDGVMRSLRTVQMQDDALASLADLLKREALLAGEESLAPLWIESVLPSINWQRVGGARTVNPFISGGEALSAFLEN